MLACSRNAFSRAITGRNRTKKYIFDQEFFLNGWRQLVKSGLIQKVQQRPGLPQEFEAEFSEARTVRKRLLQKRLQLQGSNSTLAWARSTAILSRFINKSAAEDVHMSLLPVIKPMTINLRLPTVRQDASQMDSCASSSVAPRGVGRSPASKSHSTLSGPVRSMRKSFRKQSLPNYNQRPLILCSRSVLLNPSTHAIRIRLPLVVLLPVTVAHVVRIRSWSQSWISVTEKAQRLRRITQRGALCLSQSKVGRRRLSTALRCT